MRKRRNRGPILDPAPRQPLLTWADLDLEEIERMLMNGLTNRTIARRLGVPYARFKELLSDGSDEAAAIAEANASLVNEVEAALFQRATGWVKEETVELLDKDGDPILSPDGEPMLQKKTTQLPPDVAAAQFFLKNRAPERWRDKVEHDVNAKVETSLSEVDKGDLARRIAFVMNSVQYTDADFEEVDDPKQLSN